MEKKTKETETIIINSETKEPAQTEKVEKQTFFSRVKHGYDVVMSTKVGKTAVKLVKGAAVGAACLLSFKAGKKAGTQVKVEVTDATPEPEVPTEETPTEETVEETELE